jgi:hypothetical protein
MKVTTALLRRKGACATQVDKFAALFPAGVEVTEALCIAHAPMFNWNWAARNLLRATARKAYEEACATARKAYEEACATAWKAYAEACAPARKAYAEAYAEACAPARKAYEEACAPARKAYEEACASAFGRAAELEG